MYKAINFKKRQDLTYKANQIKREEESRRDN